MAKDPVCGMFVEESPGTIKHTTEERTYYFCSVSCLNEFTAPEKELKKLRMQVALSVVLTIPIMVLTYLHVITPAYVNNFILLILASPIQFWAGWRFYRGLWDSIKAKASNMDALIAIGTSAAYFYSVIVTILPGFFPFDAVYFDTAAMITSLILIGRLLESRTKEKASHATRKLLDLQPRMAKVLRMKGEGRKEKGKGKDTAEMIEQEIPIEQVQKGELVVIRPGERIPIDGKIVEGSSSIDESSITGESIPIDKSEGQDVIGGTINKNGLLQVKATKVGQDTVLSQIITLVEQARTGKANMQRLADKVAKYFVPSIVIIAVAAGLGWFFLGNIGLSFSVLAFVSVMIIACPCALGIATPAALMMGSGKAAENGILFKGGEFLEIAKKVQVVVFDKTGTLTKGKPEVTDIFCLSSSVNGPNEDEDIINKAELLRLAAISESGSEHPLGQAIVKKAKEEDIMVINPDSFEAVAGHGIRAKYAGHVILIGNRKLMDENKIPVLESTNVTLTQLESQGKTSILVAIDNKLSGIIALADTIKESAKETIDSLKEIGIEVIILTGDNQKTADAIGSKLGISRIVSQVLPQQKEQVISKIKEEKHKIVAMVGDGINDAPALAAADLGIAVGSGTDVAKETGGIILIKDDLRDVVAALELGRKTVAKIRQNLFWAFGYNTGLIPIAAGVLVPFMGASVYSWLPFLAAGAMAISSVTVVGNSLLLGRYKPKFAAKKPELKKIYSSKDHKETLPSVSRQVTKKK